MNLLVDNALQRLRIDERRQATYYLLNGLFDREWLIMEYMEPLNYVQDWKGG